MLQGILLDYWQRPIPVDGGKFFGDVGLAGPDGGKGGKFLLLPPGYKGTVPNQAFTAFIPSGSAAQFADAQQYEGRRSPCRKDSVVQGKPEIIVNSPRQITMK